MSGRMRGRHGQRMQVVDGVWTEVGPKCPDYKGHFFDIWEADVVTVPPQRARSDVR